MRGSQVLGFTLERFVNEVNGVWQEVVVCDGTRLVLWHGEDLPPGDGRLLASARGVIGPGLDTLRHIRYLSAKLTTRRV